MKLLLKIIIAYILVQGICVLSPLDVRAAVAVVNTPTANVNLTGGASISFSFQCNTGTDLLVIKFATYELSANITSMTFDGNALTPRANSADQDSEIVHSYTLTAPPTGSSKTLQINFSPNSSFGGTTIPICVSGAHPTTPIGNTANFNSGSQASPLSTAISMSAGSMAIDVTSTSGSSVTTHDASQTLIYEGDWGGSERASASYKLAATNMVWTYSGSRRVAHVIIEVKAAASVSTTIRHRSVIQ